MASKEFLEKCSELETARANAAQAVTEAKQHLQATEDLWDGIVDELADDVTALSCDKCFQEGVYEVVEGPESRWEYCTCEHGKEARQDAEDTQVERVLFSRMCREVV